MWTVAAIGRQSMIGYGFEAVWILSVDEARSRHALRKFGKRTILGFTVAGACVLADAEIACSGRRFVFEVLEIEFHGAIRRRGGLGFSFALIRASNVPL